eukprot:PITA_04331
MIRWVQRKGKLGGYTNSTFLALIPKENQPTSFSRLRPISLCNSSYKILTKILATRLKPLLPSLISENQGGFMPNRHITDSILLVQEAIHSSLSRKEKGFVLKLDLANAFNRVRHSLLIVVLKKMGFETPFINIIVACISGPWISPLVNGRPGETFQSSQGLRQGCPLSPYLFILMAESFSQVQDHNRRVGLITGIKFGNGVKNINHSQFAYDTLLIGGASTTIARHFKNLLDQYMGYSGGVVNHHKSCVYGWNISNQTAHSIANIFGVTWNLEWNHFSYLGMPVSLGPLKAKTWNGIIDKVKRKVQQWGTMWLNPASRLILLKSGITSLPLYRFSLCQAPAIFHHKLEIALRHFLWQGGKNDKSRFNLVSWKNVIQTQDRGGLGIRSPKILNLAFGVKMVWRLITGPMAWWKKVLEIKYLNFPRQQLLDSNMPNRDSTKIWRLCKKALLIMMQNTSKVPGGGTSINFGIDKIMGQQPLIMHQEATPVINYFNNRGIHNLDQISSWDPCTHAWTGWSIPEIPTALEPNLSYLKMHLHSKSPTKKEETDGFRWDPTGSNYTVKSGHQHICNNTFQMTLWNHWKIAWRTKALPKIKFFIWLLLKGKNLTAKNLKGRARNKKIFQDKSPNARTTCSKAKSLALEVISINTTRKIEATNYSVEERDLISYILERYHNVQESNKREVQNNVEARSWKIRLKDQEFNNWIQSNNYFYLFFDGASKSNPGIAGAGGLIFNAKGDCILRYEWSLGKVLNNRAEALALFQGLTQLGKLGIKKAMVFGDSSIVIRLMVHQQNSPNTLLQQVNLRNRILHQTMEDIQCFHVLRSLNKKVDDRANSACGRPAGTLKCNST